MGTDIHGVFQRHDAQQGKYIDIPSEYEQDRHYQLFAVLAGVRNGRGFAGIQTGEAVTPISEPRGLPNDFEIVDGDSHPIAYLEAMDPRRRKWHQECEPLEIWMGDHTHSWLTSTEMLSWYENAPSVVRRGVLSRSEFDAWDKETQPTSYCGAISGPSVLVVNECDVGKTDDQWSHVSVTWESPLKTELAYFFDEVRRLHELHGEVRFVFGFDS
ncbi:conserved hypothetical protein [Burkholderia gladioli]|nr:conserved hypothetical protein [Burkholderia gladioli]